MCFGLVALLLSANALAATEQDKQDAIDTGLAYLASTMTETATEGYWPLGNNGTLAATASAALAFIEEEYPPSDATQAAKLEKALNYIFNRATNDDYGMYFNPGEYSRSVYTTGIVAPVIFALGDALGPDTVIGRGTVATQTYRQLMQDVVYWFCWGQNDDGGWRYYPNYGGSDNSTAQWGGLPLLYAQAWGLTIQDPSNLTWNVLVALNSWVNNIQNANGGSGYTTPWDMVNVSKTGGLLIELAAIGASVDDSRVQNAISFINSRWNDVPSGTWYGNLMHSYAMWAVYKGLEVYGYMQEYGSGPGEDFLIGDGIGNAPSVTPIGQDWWDPQVSSVPGDWYSHYCQVLVDTQRGDGGWDGYSYWESPLATGWYINILNATGILPPQEITVAVDIKPTSCPNPLQTGKKGVTPVAILGTDEFDVTEIDPVTVLLEGVAPLRWSLKDVATPFSDDIEDCMDCTTQGPDGHMDLTLKFDTQELVTALDEVEDRECRVLTLTGNLTEEAGGTDIVGEDVVRIQLKKMKKIATLGNSPNPFNPNTTILYTLAEKSHVRLSIYNILGQNVRTLVNELQPAGDHSVQWDGHNASGQQVTTGVYLYRLEAGTNVEVQKMFLAKEKPAG